MARKEGLVTEHLEDISGEILAADRNVIRALIRGRSGVYALYSKKRLYYVGLATNMMGRLKQHIDDRHSGAWDRFSVYLTVHDRHLKEMESLLLRIATPPGNKQSGKFHQSTALYKTLYRKLKDSDEERRANLLGGRVATRRLKKRMSNGVPKRRLAGVFPRAIRLKAWRAGWEYQATLRRDGTIRYGNKTFETPSHAGGTAIKNACNGWTFWHYRHGKEWVPLQRLRRS